MNQDFIEKLIANDNHAFKKFIAEYENSIISVMMDILRNREDVKDCRQSFLIKLPSKLLSYDASRPFRNWLLRVAYNHTLKCAQKHNEDSETVSFDQLDDEERIAFGMSPEEYLLKKEERDILLEARDALSDHREVKACIMYHYDELEYCEIAEHFSESVEYTRVLVSRGLDSMGDWLDKNYPGYFPY